MLATAHPGADTRFPSAAKRLSDKPSNWLALYAIGITPFILALTFVWPYQQYNPIATTIFACLCYIVGLLYCNKASGQHTFFVLTMFSLKFLSSYLILWLTWFGTQDWDRTQVYVAFDPATYDAFAAWVVESGEPLHNFMTPAEMGNYPYIINLYATLYSFLGSSVLNAASFNSLLIALSYFFFYRVAIGLGARPNIVFYLGWMFIIPEIVYFTAMPGKEASSLAVAGAITFFVFELARPRDLLKWDFIVAILVAALLGGVRKHIVMSIGAVCVVIRIVLLMDWKRPVTIAFATFYSMVVLGALLSVGAISKYLSPYMASGLVFKPEEVNSTLEILDRRQEFMFSTGSITRRLIPYSPSQSILFLPIRTVFYIISPFPPRFLPLKNEHIGDLFTPMTSFMGILGVFTLGIMASSLVGHQRHVLGPKAWVPFFWVGATVALISYSYFAIHERYRLFSLPMWLVSIYFGIRSPHRTLFIWLNLGLIVLGAAVYFMLRG